MHLHTLPPALGGTFRIIQKLATKGLLKKSDHSIAVSKWIADNWRQAYPSDATNCHTVYNGISVPSRRAEKQYPRNPVFGIATRLVPEKGLEEFIEFAKSVKNRCPIATFFVAGDGAEKYKYILESEVEAAGLLGSFFFLGHIASINTFWEQLDVAVFTAPYEPFGLRLIEPVACGVPSVAYWNGSGSDEVIRMCGGVRAVQYNEPDRLAELALELVCSGELRQEVCVTGLQDIRLNFSLENMGKKIEDIYNLLPRKRV